MLNYAKYREIKQIYGDVASWAIWTPWTPLQMPKANIGDISFFEQPTTELLRVLNPNIILVGLNISKRIERPFGNFHPDYIHANDYKIRYAVQGTPIWGAYMTDIIKDFEHKVSGKVEKYLRSHPEFAHQNIIRFKQELPEIGAKNPLLIAFGNATYKILKANLNDEFNICKVSHYSHFPISKENLQTEFQIIIKAHHL
jgi:hypothetical protein